jgi:hypothetical protein
MFRKFTLPVVPTSDLININDFASHSCSTCEYFNSCTLAKELISLTSLKPTQFVFECWHKTFDRKAQTDLINMVEELEL